KHGIDPATNDLLPSNDDGPQKVLFGLEFAVERFLTNSEPRGDLARGNFGIAVRREELASLLYYSISKRICRPCRRCGNWHRLWKRKMGQLVSCVSKKYPSAHLLSK